MNPERILAIQVTRIGDTLLVVPSLRALAEHFPAAQIDVLGHPQRAEVLQNLPFLHRVGSITKRSAPWRGHTGRAYDLAVVWGQDSALVRYALRQADEVVACTQKDAALNRRLKAAVTLPSDRELPLSHWQLQLLELGLGISTEQRHVEVALSAAEIAWAQDYRRRLAAPGPLVGIVLETFPTSTHRNWPIEHFARCLQLLEEQVASLQVIVLGQNLAQDKIAVLRQRLGGRLHLGAGLSLRQSMALIAHLDLYLGLDTGPSHIASALPVPSVCLFHCMRRGPLVLSPRYPERLIMIEHPTPSAACSFALDMSAISPEQVFAACWQQLQKYPWPTSC